MSILQDIYATIISAAGGDVPVDSTGKNLIARIMDSGYAWRDKIFAEFGMGRALKFMLRWGDYKYIYHTNGGLEDLFDLHADPDELNNIAATHQDVCEQCRTELVQYYKSYGFDEALNGEELKRYSYEAHVKKGYLNMYPTWQKTVVD